MQGCYPLLSIFILTSFLIGCASGTIAHSKIVENPTPRDVPAKPAAAGPEVPAPLHQPPPINCPVTTPRDSRFTAPAPYSANAPWTGLFWYGSTSLWVALPTDGVWSSLPHNPEGYTQKISWWREGYDWNTESEPPLIVTGERLDAKAPPLHASSANGSYAADMGSAMMMGVDFPTPGCWKITGHYKDAELSFVVWVAP